MILLTSALALLLAIAPQAPAPANLTTEFTQLQKAWADARIHADVAFLEKFYAKELRIIGMTGTPMDRDADIALFASHDIRPEVITDEDLRILPLGHTADTVVVTGIETNTGSYKQRTGTVVLRFTNVFVRRDGRWQLVASQSTPIPSPAPSKPSGQPSPTSSQKPLTNPL